MIVTTNFDNLQQQKIRFPLNGEQILTFASHNNMFIKVKNLPANFKQIV